MGKKITEMSDEELNAAILELQDTHIPSAPTKAKRPKRLDDAKPRKKSLLDLVEE